MCVCVCVCVCVVMMVMILLVMVVGGECGIVCNCPVAHMAGTLASTSPFSAALWRGPSGILLIGLHAGIVEQKCYTRETCRFADRTPMRLKTSALEPHQN